MNISTAAKQSGLTAKTIRYYEDIGLLPPAARGDTGYRDYADGDISLQRFVRRARDLGFSVKECRSLIELYLNPDRASRDVQELALAKIDEIDLRIKEFELARAQLKSLTVTCQGNENADCSILNKLSSGDR